MLISRPVALICSAISAAERAPCCSSTAAIAEPIVWRASAGSFAFFETRFGFGSGSGACFALRAAGFSRACSSRSAIRRSTIFVSSSAIFSRMRSSAVSIDALQMLIGVDWVSFATWPRESMLDPHIHREGPSALWFNRAYHRTLRRGDTVSRTVLLPNL
ncbi:hypothetical protein MPC4_60177 [Methylocella tundrae]|uniref:Uncharacterized protein n=1 Tax=Methylocella tundrae TaxID=227605 RepID=A0A8B6MAN3_METTU|nr:hypothetical protein MPC1_360009 [Methylocella tundrae]VTZ52087.1 hypothetical protein MPC4_60177 [Methylocella tundrae]